MGLARPGAGQPRRGGPDAGPAPRLGPVPAANRGHERRPADNHWFCRRPGAAIPVYAMPALVYGSLSRRGCEKFGPGRVGATL